jgi:hypothetical protein
VCGVCAHTHSIPRMCGTLPHTLLILHSAVDELMIPWGSDIPPRGNHACLSVARCGAAHAFEGITK